MDQFAVTGTGPDAIKELQKRLYAVADPSNPKATNAMLRKRFREKMGPAKTAIQQAVLATPSAGVVSEAHSARGGKSGGGKGLRQRVSELVTVTATTTGRSPGVSMKIASSRMPAGQTSLPKLLEGVRPWRHPVYGGGRKVRSAWTWVTQAPHPYFYKTAKAGKATWRAACLAAMHDVASYVNSKPGA